MDTSKLISLLQSAHAGEKAAFHAYEGHWRSVRDTSERIHIQLIQLDELKHRMEVNRFLIHLGASPDWLKDTVLTVVGKTLGALCYVTGWLMPMWGALFIEQLGVTNYAELAMEADKAGYRDMSEALLAMGNKEREHEQFFIERIRARNEQKKTDL